MSSAYYYFAASLPLLNFEDAPPQPVAAFLDDCQRLLSPKDVAAMTVLLTGEGATADPFVRAWQRFQHDWRNTAAGFRASATNRDPLGYIRGEYREEPLVVGLLARAAEAPHPLAGEQILARGMWEHLGDLGQGHHFDLVTMMIYGLRLQILERFSQITTAAGHTKFQDYRRAASEALPASGRSRG